MSRPTTLDLLKEARAILADAGWDHPVGDGLPAEWVAVVEDLDENLPDLGPDPDAKKVRHAVADLAVEFAKPRPDPAAVREALDRGLRYAGLGAAAQLPETVRPAVERVRAWLAMAR